jgi:hypothetical protein
MNQPLVFYVRLNPLAATALKYLSDDCSERLYANPDPHYQLNREIHLFEMVDDENLPWETALEAVHIIQANSLAIIQLNEPNPYNPQTRRRALISVANRALAKIASRSDVPWEEALKIARSITSFSGDIDRLPQAKALAIIANREDVPREEASRIVNVDLDGCAAWQKDVFDRMAQRDRDLASMDVEQDLDLESSTVMDQLPTVEEISILPTERDALLQLQSMIQQTEVQYSDEDYLRILEGLSPVTQDLIYGMLYQAHDSPTGDFDTDGIQRILSNPRSLLPIIDQLIKYSLSPSNYVLSNLQLFFTNLLKRKIK